MYNVFVELGGLDPENAVLLFDPDVAELHGALTELRSHVAPGKGHQLIFYYSGHANDSALLLNTKVVGANAPWKHANGELGVS
jgi:hypothetical protein